MKWQPIETAPKDGTEILGYSKYCGILLIRWTSPSEFLSEDEIDKSDLTEESVYAFNWYYANFLKGGILEDGEIPTRGMLEDGEIPTHWMPLPDEPR